MMSFDTPYMWNLKEWYTGTHLQSRNGLTDVESKPVVTRWEGEG